MAFEKKDMEGAIFIEDKRQNDHSRHYRGYIMVGGQEYYLSGWKNQTDGKPPWIKLKLSRPDERRETHPATPAAAATTKKDDGFTADNFM